MEVILSSLSASISELKKDPMALLEEAEGEPVTILHNNHPFAYLVPANVYEDMLELLEDYELGQIVRERLAKEKDDAVEFPIWTPLDASEASETLSRVLETHKAEK